MRFVYHLKTPSAVPYLELNISYQVAMALEVSRAVDPGKAAGTGVSTLGHIRLRDETTNHIILIPSPSDDPKDPLNWYVNFLHYLNLCLKFAV